MKNYCFKIHATSKDNNEYFQFNQFNQQSQFAYFQNAKQI
jgi:hypothetical protein